METELDLTSDVSFKNLKFAKEEWTKFTSNGTLNTETSIISNNSDDETENTSILVKELNFRDHDIITKNEKTFEPTGITSTKVGKYFVLCDHGNGSIKLLDETFDVKCRLTSVFEPWDVTAVTPTFLLVSYPFVRLLQYLKVKDDSKVAFWYPLKSGHEYYGLACDGSSIAAVCKYDGTNRSPSVHILDQTGNVNHVIHQTKDGERLFKNPEYIAVSETSHVFYVTDSDLKRVVSFNRDGVVLQRFSRPDLDPSGICVDNVNNTVYVCDKHCVYHLGPDLQPIECLTSKHEKMVNPRSVLFLSKEDILLVTMDGMPFIRAFQM